MSQEPTTRQCPKCDCALNNSKLLMCHPCWDTLPRTLRDAFNRARDLPARREAARQILKCIRDDKQQPVLPGL